MRYARFTAKVLVFTSETKFFRKVRTTPPKLDGGTRSTETASRRLPGESLELLNGGAQTEGGTTSNRWRAMEAKQGEAGEQRGHTGLPKQYRALTWGDCGSLFFLERLRCPQGAALAHVFDGTVTAAAPPHPLNRLSWIRLH